MSELIVQGDAMTQFQEKISQKLRDDIGELLPNDALSKLIERAIEENFFKERVVETGSYHIPTRTEPSWFVATIKEMTEKMVREHVGKWCEENKDVFEKKVDQFFSREMMSIITATIIASQIRTSFDRDLTCLVENIRNKMI